MKARRMPAIVGLASSAAAALLLLLAVITGGGASSSWAAPVAQATATPTPTGAPLTMTVNSTGDEPDFIPGDGVCSTAPPLHCTLRAAIQESNSHAGYDVIRFSIASGAQTIMPGSALPDITEAAEIDGTTQPGFSGNPLIELRGSSAGTADGLRIAISSPFNIAMFVHSLAITGFTGDGIEITTDFTRLEKNWIGVRPDSTPLGNGAHGVHVIGGQQRAYMIGSFPSGGNRIQNNGGDGIFVESGIKVNINSNSISDNGGLGIDLAPDGVTPNDPQDPDTGANDLQNFPVITRAVQG